MSESQTQPHPEGAFYAHLERHGGSIALIDRDKAISYAELAKLADALGESIQSRKLLFMVCRNSADAVIGYLAALRRKTVPALYSHGISREMLAALLDQYEPLYAFAPEDMADSFPGYGAIGRQGDFLLLERAAGCSYPLFPDLALLLATSGSTGSPKMVRQSYGNISANAASIAQYLNIAGGDRALTTMPMAYTYGLSIIQSHLLRGAAIIMTDAAVTQREFWELLREHRATTFGGVPYIYEMLKKLRFGRMDLPSLRYLTQAGGHLSQELVQEYAEICRSKEMRFIVMYGQAEATARMAYLPWESVTAKAGSIGIPIPGGSLRIEDEAGRMVDAPGIEGELVYSGDNVTLGYAEHYADLAKGDENRGVLHTGDMAKRDADGYFYIVGRKSRFLKIFGVRVNLLDVEKNLANLGIQCVCSGRDNLLKLFTVDPDSVPAIEAYLRDRTTINRQGCKIYCVPEIPRNPSGKVLYVQLDAWEG